MRRLGLALLAAAILAPAGAAAAETGPALNEITAASLELGEDQVLLKVGASARVNSYLADDPPRLVLEIADAVLGTGEAAASGAGRFLKDVRLTQADATTVRVDVALRALAGYRRTQTGRGLLLQVVGVEPAAAPQAPAAAAKAAPSRPRGSFPVGYPGALWGNGTRDMNGIEGYGTQGWVRQGVQWLTLPGAIKATTFAAYHWRVRSQNRRYYDSRGPSLGVELGKAFVDAGAEYSWREFPQLGEKSENFALYANWYKRFDLSRFQAKPNLAGLPIVGLPFTTWGSFSHDLNNIEGDGAQGFVRQAVEWYRFPGSVVLRTQAAYYWRFRSKNRPYYNTHGPALGAELGWKSVDLGLEYMWRNYPELSRNPREFQLYLSWYFNWDLKDLASGKR